MLLTEVSEQEIILLHQGFEWGASSANAYAIPDDIDASVTFKPAIVPCTVAMLIEHAHELVHLDAQDHWYRTTFSADPKAYQKTLLQLDGLLTFADVYLNGALILQSLNAYHVHEVDVTLLLQASNQLAICFRAIRPFYTAKHPRAKYITRLINERHLRFIRTPVLGYTPGFSAPTKHVGPYRPIRLIRQNAFSITSSWVSTQLLGDDQGLAEVNVMLQALEQLPDSASLNLYDEATNQVLKSELLSVTLESNNNISLKGTLSCKVYAYWPHTHGSPKRYQLKLALNAGQQVFNITLGHYGFRRIERANLETFSLHYNGVPLYFRGACWTPMHPTSLLVSYAALLQRLTLLKNAGVNMLRIPGNMLYESDDFYALCDELGILVFQDFAFTNFDYPETEDFITSVKKEITDFLNKHGSRPSMTVLCGGSEVAQQACMMGVPVDQSDHVLFTELIPKLTQARAPNVPYTVSSPYNSQGLPFHTGDGPSTYFGVGGYRRDFDDARVYKGRFIAECLPFSHIPEDESLRTFWGGEIPPPHHPLWKEGVTRDPGSGWDFSDITDFYMEKLFELSAVKLRSIEPDRYLRYCRATLVEVVETTLSIFRANSAEGRAALVWNLHDLKPGAGWGYIDVLGRPKSAFYALSRTAQPTTVLFVDEGLDGLAVYLTHDGNTALDCQLTITLVTSEGKLFEQGTLPINLNPRGLVRLSVDSVIGRFVDSSHAYRFGPRAFSAVVAQLHHANGALITQKVYAPPCETHTMINDAGLTAIVKKQLNGDYLLDISTQHPAFFVSIELPNFTLSDNYFHIIPGFNKQVLITAQQAAQTPNGRLRALNAKASSAIIDGISEVS
ncbi:glycoside hydrolase family 2 protein [Methylotenera sp.]|uniref:glycosyl hydrolase 2 galactose-binding domain-containing protein n=1 Tax=Methylotenera sp. TaxID=2051956 RepID=UPI00248A27D6|nr:glycoside hydrolase family 2 protein [Methylotenera sp.]MDI1297813.1 hypothetical protein [Methylotenera sp.]